MLAHHQRTVLNRLKTARGHLDGIMRMVEDEAYCPDLMKQLAAVQGMLEGTSRVIFRNHLETCVAEAMRAGRTEQILDELMETLKYDKRVLRPPAEPTSGRTPGSDGQATRSESRSQHG
ncbi:MAG: metal-sensitive transcriptional regulator [Actinomycetota bacterium]|nr:metal-sensitive transcriptional regulator [Actinomycetota bacterium]